jgi:hypothetical protein
MHDIVKLLLPGPHLQEEEELSESYSHFLKGAVDNSFEAKIKYI